MFEHFLKRYAQVCDDYTAIKRIVLDYNYQYGRMKALQFMTHKFKEKNGSKINTSMFWANLSSPNVHLKVLKSPS